MRIIFCLMVFLFIGKNTMLAQQLSSFVEYGAALHTGDNTPLWQVSNQQGLTSLDNNTYIRGGISYKHQLGKWKFEEALDLVAAAGFSMTSFIVQQAYVDIRYKWVRILRWKPGTEFSIAESRAEQWRHDLVG